MIGVEVNSSRSTRIHVRGDCRMSDRRFLPGLLVLLVVCSLSLTLVACTAPSSDDQSGEPVTGESGVSPRQSTTLAPEALALRLYEERRRALRNGGWETRNGPVQRLEPVDHAFVGHGEVVIELTLPAEADEELVRSALHLYPENALLRWFHDGTLEIRWPGTVYEGVTPVGTEELPTQYSLRIAPRSAMGPRLLLGGGVNIVVTRVEEPLYTIVDVDDETVRTPYERPRHGYDLTQREHVFELHFTKPMDMASVAEVLEEQLGCIGLTRFHEVDSQTATYAVMTEPGRNCTINPEGAVDSEGHPTWFGMPLRYTILPPVEVLSGRVQFGNGGPDGALQHMVTLDPGRRVATVLRQAGALVALEAGYDDEVSGPVSYLPWVHHFDATGEVTRTVELSSELGFVLEVLPDRRPARCSSAGPRTLCVTASTARRLHLFTLHR